MEPPIAPSGRAARSHTRVDEREAGLAHWRFDFVSQREDTALTFYDPTTAGGKRRSGLFIEEAGQILYESEDLEVSLRGNLPPWRASRRPIRAILRLGDSDADAEIELGRIPVPHAPPGLAPPAPIPVILDHSSRAGMDEFAI